MTKTLKILAVIPARGGSKGVPKKNIKSLGGKPLLAYTVESAKKSKLIDRLILSSEDKEIIEIAKKLNLEVPFVRPQELASDQSGSLEVVQHAVKFLEQQSDFYNAVLLLQPTSPFRPIEFIDQAIKKFLNADADALVSVLPIPHQFNPHWVFEEDVQGFLNLATGDQNIIKQRQQLPKAYFRDGSIYLTKTEVIKQGSFFGKKLSYIESNPDFHVNIDNLADWGKAEKMVETYNSIRQV